MGRRNRVGVGASDILWRWASQLKALRLVAVALVLPLACNKSSSSQLELSQVAEALNASEWPSDGLVATNSIMLGTSAQVTATLVTVRQTNPSGAELALDTSSRITGSVRADSINLATSSAITGNARYNTRTGSGTVGSSATPLTLPVPLTVPALPAVSPGAQVINVSAGQVVTKSAGNYGAVTVNGRLILSGGTYHVASIVVGQSDRLECAADCELRVNTQVEVGELAFIGASGPGLTARNMRIVVKGSNDGDASYPAALRIRNEAQLTAYVLAPNGTVRLGTLRGGTVKGKVVAKDVTVGAFGVNTLMDAPAITQQPASTSVINGQPATFSVTSTGDSLTYQWKRNGTNIAGATTSTLTFTTNSAHNNTTYTVVVTNPAGNVTSSSATLTVVPCTATDTSCDGKDNDCDGLVDDDYVPTCGQGAGAPRLACIGGAVVSAPCVDATVCNGTETCLAGICQAGTPLVVDDNKICTVDACNPTTGVSHTKRATGTSCSDSLGCNGAATCDSSGECQAGTPLPFGLETGCCDPDADAYLWQSAPIDPTIVTTYAARATPLFIGFDRSQAPLDEEVIDTSRVAIVQGKVVNESGAPVSCVQVSVLHHDEIGSARTLADGSFALAVNGGETVTLQYSHPSFLTSNRDVSTQPLTDAFAPEIKLIPYGAAHAVSASATTTTIVTGEKETDQDGTRKAVMLVPPGTSATVDGESTPRQNYEIRVKEVTNLAEVGRDGMLATLPPQTMFTYAVSFDLVGAENKDVVLNKEIPVYVENFLENPIGFEVGETVPVGRYDIKTEQWIAQESGRIIQILGQDTAGRARLDLNFADGEDNIADFPELGITEAERVTLAQRYPKGAKLWRFRVKHFSLWDANWPGDPDPGDGPPSPDDPDDNDDDGDDDDGDDGDDAPGPDGPNSCEKAGSIIQCERQVLMEEVPVHGAPFKLRYSSSRQPGYGRQLNIPLTGPTLSSRVKRVEVRVQVAGREFEASYAPAPNLNHAFSWDGRDSSGRVLSGRQKVGASIGYTYPISYQQTDTFGYNGNGTKISGDMSRGEITMWKDWKGEIGGVSAQYSGLGGWNVDIHHALDRDTGRVYLGSGGGFKVPDDYAELSTVAGTGATGFSGDGGPATQAKLSLDGNAVNSSVAVAADGTVYFSDPANNRVRRVSSEGIITTFAGGGSALGDGGPATQAKLNNPSAIALGPDGHVYVADSLQHRIRKINVDNGTISTVVGNGQAGFSGDFVVGSPAQPGTPTLAQLNKPTGLTIAADGTMFIADSLNARIRRVRDGVITTAVSNDEVPNTIGYPTGVAVAPDGTLYFSDFNLHQIKKLTTGGAVSVVVGTGAPNGGVPPYGDGGPALNAQLLRPDGVAIGPDGLLYIVDKDHHLVRRVNSQGNVESVVGTATFGYSGENLPATRSQLYSPRGLTVAPDGSIYVVDTVNGRIRRVRPSVRLRTAGGNLLVPLKKGTQLAEFDNAGRHLRTLDAYTGAVLFQFGYDVATGRWLTEVTDVDGRTTEIIRDSVTGRAENIESPDGHVTQLDIQFAPDGDILKEIERPDAGRYVFTYSQGGLLQTMRDPKLEDEGGDSFIFEFTNGRLTKDTDPLGWEQLLSHSYAGGERTVTTTTPLGVSHTYKVSSTDQTYQRVIGRPDGTTHTTDIRSDLKPAFLAPNGKSYDERVTNPDGSIAYYQVTPAPIWGLNAPVTTEDLFVLPSGRTRTRQATQALTLDPATGGLATETRTSRLNGRLTTVQWNGTTRTFTKTSPGNRTNQAILNQQGRIVELRNPGALPIYLDYAEGRLANILQGTRSTTFEYETTPGPKLGNLLRVTNALGQVIQFGTDDLGRITSVTNPDQSETGLGWDANGNLTSVAPAETPIHTQNFDLLNQQTSYLPPALASVPVVETQFHTDADRNPERIVRPEGEIHYYYDATGRLSWSQSPQGATYYAYYSAAPPTDGAPGALESITAPSNVALHYKYNGPLTKAETWSGGGLTSATLHREFDDDFRVATEAISGPANVRTVTYGYDADSQLNCLSASGCPTPADEFTLKTLYNVGAPRPDSADIKQVSSSWSYTSYGEVSQLDTRTGATILFRQNLNPSVPQGSRDDLGRVQANQVTNGGAAKLYQYGYDLQGRLETVREAGSLIETYTYDDNGNRKTLTTPTGQVSAAYDDQDRLQSYGSFTYQYNNNGDLKRKENTVTHEVWQYTYDARGNLTRALLPNGTKIDYLVDGRNRRVGKLVNDVLVRQWVWSSQLRIAAELNGSGQVLSQFLYGNQPTTPELVIQNGTTFRVAYDHLGSVRALVNVNTPTVVPVRMDYKAFGEVSGTGIGTIPQGFAGGLYDSDTGLVRFGARDYDPVVGRWVSKDPLLFDGGQANLYVYAGNDPVNRLDPAGLWYVDVGASWGSGGTTLVGGFYITSDGIYSYSGAGGGTPGPGFAAMFSLDDVSPELWSTQVSIGAGNCGLAMGWDETGSTFEEFGISTPGFSVTRYTTKKRLDWSSLFGDE